MSKFLDENGLLYFWNKLKTLLAGKVDKESGKGLSTNDYTTAEKTKLSNIEEDANNYMHPAYLTYSTGFYKFAVDSSGHVGDATAVTKSDITALGIPSTNTTYSAMTGATSSAAGTSGLVPAPAAGKNTSFLRGDGTWVVPTNTTYADMTGATSSADGTHGLVPAPAKGKQTSFLRGDGTWVVPTNTTYTNATTSASGLMSAADKTKLDGVADGANNYVHPAYTTYSSGLYKVTVDATGHVSAATAVAKSDITALGIPSTNTTYSVMGAASDSAAGTSGLVPAPAAGKNTSFLRGDGTWVVPTDTTYSVMGAASASAAGSSGLVPAPAAGKQASFLRGDGTWVVPKNTTYSNMKGATSSAAGTAGLVPAPAAGYQSQFLRGDGTWATPEDTIYSVATSSANGLMSSTDKAKLDAFGAASTYALKTDISGVYKYKGSKASLSALPTSGNTTGDVYNTEDTGMNYAWTGSAWDALGSLFSVEAISNSEIDTVLAS
jgi:hypothetical protein